MISMIIIGANNQNECTYNSLNANIPVWLIVFGSFVLNDAILLIILTVFET